MAPTIVRPRVFLDVNIGVEPVGRLVIELFIDKAPKSCENFRALCNGSHPPLSYGMTPFHRIIDEFMVQGGDITKGNGTGGKSIYGDTFDDENIGWREIDVPGLVCMANRGKNTNSSQFFITLAPCEHLNAKHTVFGHLVSGQQTLERMAKAQVDREDRPTTDVIIAHCGELERKKNAGTERRQETVEERGRIKRRRSTSYSPNRSASPSREHTRESGSRHRHHHRKHHRPSSSDSASPGPKPDRRRSDASFDHNLRGRVRQRPGSKPTSAVPESTVVSPHHRKRDSPPSRSPTGNGDRSRSPDYRRQRSLPNQYDRNRKRYDDRDRERDARKLHQRGDEEWLRQKEWEREGGADRYADVLGEDDHGRLRDDGGRDEPNGDGIKYKGRGTMKFRGKNRW